MIEPLTLSPDPSPARGRGENTDGLLPSPSGRGAGGEGRRLTHHEFIRQLRSNQTTAEQRLWYHLRAHRFLGLKFKRQMPIGPYIADFLCMEYKLIVEADGGQHGSLSDFDRDQWLEAQGYTVLRFWNNQVHEETDGVLEAIRLTVLAKGLVEPPALSPNPSPARGRGEQADCVLPSPSGRGAGGEGRRVKSRRVP
ncbi:endonuclease domain-containing protein [Cupriavidus sp. SW-Y-13]|uniref:endonuclease domain-containing protein n=1 Tax=Cupriavidus sp. SW-Y-13 TaxID=2653854 RepID=UPI001365C068|nr:endonuclease domain-containing protein [Cupriavidus sp. SW-Y-13]MWL86709.1 DUF559 domain-containing protein [Cupriavidus sp. SW-Y-13]